MKEAFKLDNFKLSLSHSIHLVDQTHRINFLLSSSVTRKKSPIVYENCPKMIPLKNERFWQLYKNCL